jgi:Putative cyclase
MKIVDLSHVMNVHTPGWVGYAGNKMYYAQNLQTQMIVAQRIDTALHVGTHFDGAMHATDNRKGDMASIYGRMPAPGISSSRASRRSAASTSWSSKAAGGW